MATDKDGLEDTLIEAEGVINHLKETTDIDREELEAQLIDLADFIATARSLAEELVGANDELQGEVESLHEEYGPGHKVIQELCEVRWRHERGEATERDHLLNRTFQLMREHGL